MTTKVHLMTVLLIDHDKLGAEGTAQVLEDTRYPNDCLYPSVLSTQTQEVTWDDDHPLNGNAESVAQAVAELFPRPAWTCHICGAPPTSDQLQSMLQLEWQRGYDEGLNDGMDK
jgi:hypothetical protein